MNKLATFACFLAITMFAVGGQVMPSVMKEIQTSTFIRGLLLACSFLLFPLSAFFGGVIADRVGKRRLVVIGVTFMGLGFGLCALGNSIPLWLAGMCVFGIGAGATEGQATAYVGDLNPGKERKMINLSQVFFCIGAVASPAVLGMVKKRLPGLPLTTRFMWIAVLNLIVVLGFLAVKDVKLEKKESYNKVKMLELFSDVWLLRLMLAIFLYVLVEGATVGWLAAYAHDIFALSQASSPFFISVVWAAIGLSRLLTALVPSRVSSKVILIASLLVMMLGRVVFVLAGTSRLGYTGTVIMGLGMGSVWPTLISVISSHYPKRSGEAVGLMIAAGGIAIPVGNLYMGLIASPDVLGIRFGLLTLIAFSLLNLTIIFTTRMDNRSA